MGLRAQVDALTQFVADSAFGNVVYHAATLGTKLQCGVLCCNVLFYASYVATCGTTLQRVTPCCSVQIDALKQFMADSVHSVPVTAILVDLYAGRCSGSTSVRFAVRLVPFGLADRSARLPPSVCTVTVATACSTIARITVEMAAAEFDQVASLAALSSYSRRPMLLRTIFLAS